MPARNFDRALGKPFLESGLRASLSARLAALEGPRRASRSEALGPGMADEIPGGGKRRRGE